MAVIVSMMSGLESFVKREVEALADRGYQLKLYATQYKASPGFDPRDDIPFAVANVRDVIRGAAYWVSHSPKLVLSLLAEARRMNGLVELALALSWAADLQQQGCQLIHCAFGDRKYFIGYFLHRLTQIPLTVAIHAHEIYAQPNPALFQHALKFTAGIVTISEKNKQLLIEKYGIPPASINMIRLTIDLDFWKQERDVIKVLTVARFTPRKGWHELLTAARLLGPRFHFYAVGFGDLDIAALAKSQGVSNQITVFPKLQPPHLKLLMQACDIFCLPSKPTPEEGSEGIPVVLMEAMAMDLPIVTTNDGSISELVEREIVAPGDAAALAEGLRRCAAGLHQPPAQPGASRNRVESMHSEGNFEELDRFFKSRVLTK